jgi:hypothetical protein
MKTCLTPVNKTRLASVNDDTLAAARTGHGIRQNVWVTIV